MKIIEWIKSWARWVLEDEITEYETTVKELHSALTDMHSKFETLEHLHATVSSQRDQLHGHLTRFGQLSEWGKQQQRDRERADKGGVVQLFCEQCKIGVGDEEDMRRGNLDRCPSCGGDQFLHSWEFEL